MDFSFFRLTFFVKGFQAKSLEPPRGGMVGAGEQPPPLGAYLLIIGIIRGKGEEPSRLAVKRAGNKPQVYGNIEDANNLLGTNLGHTQGSVIAQSVGKLTSAISPALGSPPGHQGTRQGFVFKARLAGGTSRLRGLFKLGKVGASLAHHVGGAEFPANLAQGVLGHGSQDVDANAHHLGVRNTGGLGRGGGASGGGVVGSHKAAPFPPRGALGVVGEPFSSTHKTYIKPFLSYRQAQI